MTHTKMKLAIKDTVSASPNSLIMNSRNYKITKQVCIECVMSEDLFSSLCGCKRNSKTGKLRDGSNCKKTTMEEVFTRPSDLQ